MGKDVEVGRKGDKGIERCLSECERGERVGEMMEMRE